MNSDRTMKLYGKLESLNANKKQWEERMTYRELGEKYNVTSVTACYHCNKDYNKYMRELRVAYSLSHRDKERTLASVKRTYSKKIALHEEGLI